MSGRDLHLPRLRLGAPRGWSASSSSSRSSPSSGRRGHPPLVPMSARPGNRWIRSSSEDSTPSTHKSHSSTHDPSDHEWDSPGWRRRRLPRSRLAYSSSSTSLSPDPEYKFSCWSPTSSQKRAIAAQAKNMDRIRGLTKLRHDSLISPPPLNSPADYERQYRMGLLQASPTFHSAPNPFWSDEGYLGSDSDSSNAPNSRSSSCSPRRVRSEGCPEEPGFSLPFFASDSVSNIKARKGMKTKGMKGIRLMFEYDE